jgi:hypothetical protein
VDIAGAGIAVAPGAAAGQDAGLGRNWNVSTIT